MQASIIFGVIRDEYERLSHLKESLSQILDELPKGTIRLKKVDSHEYAYFRYCVNGKSREQYIGKKSCPKVRVLNKNIHMRVRVEKQLLSVNKELKELEKALKKEKR